MNAATQSNVLSMFDKQELPSTIKPLNSKFQSFGEALFSWTNGMGFESTHEKQVDGDMVRGFCHTLEIPYVKFETKDLMVNGAYFESTAWLEQFLALKGFQRTGGGFFILLDDHYRPIASVEILSSPIRNIGLVYTGCEIIGLELRRAIMKNIKMDPAVVNKPIYLEVLQNRLGGLQCEREVVTNERIALPEFYPYLEGGGDALLKGFMESEESVLILLGPPGTGKSSLISSAIESLGLLPIYAKKTKVIKDDEFVNFVFKLSDGYMEQISGTAAKARKDLFLDKKLLDDESLCKERMEEEGHKDYQQIPVVVAEDADVLMAPRSDGNPLMADLLNATDGIGSNHNRKIIFTTNATNVAAIDEALMRAGRCYEVINCRLLTPQEAVIARRAGGLPDFDVVPTEDVSLAVALRKPRARISVAPRKTVGFGS